RPHHRRAMGHRGRRRPRLPPRPGTPHPAGPAGQRLPRPAAHRRRARRRPRQRLHPGRWPGRASRITPAPRHRPPRAASKPHPAAGTRGAPSTETPATPPRGDRRAGTKAPTPLCIAAAIPAPLSPAAADNQAASPAERGRDREETTMRAAFLRYLVQTWTADPCRQVRRGAPALALALAATAEIRQA